MAKPAQIVRRRKNARANKKKADAMTLKSSSPQIEKEIEDYLNDEPAARRIEQLDKKYSESLSARERDFALRYAIDPTQRIETWSKFYGVHKSTIKRWLGTTAVRSMISDIQSDARKFQFTNMLYLGHEALRVYREILAMPIDPRDPYLVSTIRKTADKVTDLVMAMAGITPQDNKGAQPNIQFNVNGPAAIAQDNERVVVQVVGVKSEIKEEDRALIPDSND